MREHDINEIMKIVENSPTEIHHILLIECRKVFDIGFEFGDSCIPLDYCLSLSILQKIVALNSDVNIRIYPATRSTSFPQSHRQCQVVL